MIQRPTFPGYRNFLKTFKDAPGEQIIKVDATAPVQWWLARNDQFSYGDILDRFPPVLQPPYPLLWLESEPIPSVTTHGFAALAYAVDLEAEGLDRGQKEARWAYALKLFRSDGHPITPMEKAETDVELLIRPDGSIERFGSEWIGKGLFDERESWAIGTIVITEALMSAISFMNCKGVDVVERTTHHGQAGRKGAFKITYRILDIEAVGRRLDVAGAQHPEVGPTKAFHLCRGHIKTYTAEAPLFGKYVGAVWCPPHARGRPESGLVMKDYRVKKEMEE